MEKQKRYFVEIVQRTDGTFKFAFAKQLVDINQHARKWRNINARGVARKVNRGKIVIK